MVQRRVPCSLAGILVYEHLLLRPQDLSRVNTAFFTLNGLFSILLFVIVLLDIWLFQISSSRSAEATPC